MLITNIVNKYVKYKTELLLKLYSNNINKIVVYK